MKKAVLVVSFGTSYKETRKKTIEACENKIKETLKGYDFYRAYTSNKIINKIKKSDGIIIDNPKQALDKLYENGYEEVVVQTLHIICGNEFNKLEEGVKEYENKFKSIKLGRALLTEIGDYLNTVKAIKYQIPAMKNNEAVVFMGHGSEYETYSAYTTLEYMLRDANINAFVGTIDGYPRIEHVMRRLKKHNIKKVNLMPFLLVAGVHAVNDMAGEKDNSWKSILEEAGFEVNVELKGLGENPKIQDIFAKYACDCIK